MKKIIPFILLLLLPLAAWAELEIIDLKHRSAEDLLPIVRPLLDKDGVASGMNYQLILRASPRNIAEIKKLVERLDVAPRMLKISVMQDVDRDTADRMIGLSGSVGNNPRISIPDQGNGGASIEVGGGGNRLKANVISTRTLEGDHKTQQTQVLEGNRALVRTGQSMPVPQRQVIQHPWGTEVVDSTEYRNVESGFYVLPRVSGDRVTLEITAQNDSPATGQAYPQTIPQPVINVQHAVTTLSGRLGEWMEIGGTGQEQQIDDGTISTRSLSRKHEQRSVLIKVDEVR